MSIAADQSNPLSRVHPKIHLVKQEVGTVRLGEAENPNHRGNMGSLLKIQE